MRRFPELCEQIRVRFEEHKKNSHPPPKQVLKAFRNALRKKLPPSLQLVLRNLGCNNTGSYYYRHYPKLCALVAERYRSYWSEPFRRDEDCQQLKEMLIEEPPPSFSEAARRFGRKRDFLRHKFPELSTVLTARYKHYQAALREEKARRLREVIREALEQLKASGVYPSVAKVKERSKRKLAKLGREKNFAAALREVKSEMGLLD